MLVHKIVVEKVQLSALMMRIVMIHELNDLRMFWAVSVDEDAYTMQETRGTSIFDEVEEVLVVQSI